MENLILLLRRLLESQLDFVLIGGYAAVVHGSSQVTHDLDICAVISESSLEDLRQILKDLDPKHRMNPNFQPGLNEYPQKGHTLENYYLRTTAGVLDIIRDVKPLGDFQRIKERSVTINVFGKNCRVIALDDLIDVKRSMTREKDKAVLKELLEIKKKRG